MLNSSFGNHFLPFLNTASPFIQMNEAVLTYVLNLLFTSLGERCCQSPQEHLPLAKGWCNPYRQLPCPSTGAGIPFLSAAERFGKASTSSSSPLHTDAPILLEVIPPSLQVVSCGFNERSKNSSIKFGRTSILVSVASGTRTWNWFPKLGFHGNSMKIQLQ